MPARDYPLCPARKISPKAFSVNMAGYRPRSFFASLGTSTPSQSINSKKKYNFQNSGVAKNICRIINTVVSI